MVKRRVLLLSILVGWVVTLIMVTGCGSDPQTGGDDSTTVAPILPTSSMVATTTTGPPGSEPTGSTVRLGEVGLINDEPYYESPDGAMSHLDVYYPSAVGEYPLVVVFHSNPVMLEATKESVRSLATMIAGRGAVVVAPTWGHPMSMGDMHAIAREAATWTNEQGPCAVWAAVDLANAVGADDSQVTLIGLTTGVLPAQAATFDPPATVDGCLFPPVPVPVEKAILFESDWMLVPSMWDEVLGDDLALLDAVSFWDKVDTPTSTRVIMLAGEVTAPETVRSLEGNTYAESEWVQLRDPDGRLAEAFASSGTLEDDSVSFTDVTDAVVTLIVEGGWDAELQIVPAAGHSLASEAAQTFVTNLVFQRLVVLTTDVVPEPMGWG